ncbi:MAG TPA: DUF2007 domain-containing protein [Terriglobales bacterium]|jgi:hypothetical protein
MADLNHDERESNVEERELETVFEAKSESEAWAVQGLLQSSGIEALVQSLEFPQDIMPGVGNIAVRVPTEQAADARQIVESYQDNPPQASEMQSADATITSDTTSFNTPPKIPSPS